ncbi:MAG: synthase subunit a, partial [Pseudomonadota bacterium]
MANPMEQFKIETIAPISAGGFDLSFTNSSLWMLIALITVASFLFIGTARPQLVPGRMQAAVELLYDFIRDMLRENVGKEGLKYAPLIFAVFIFVLACNLLGMVPFVHSFTPTSHIAVTFAMAAVVFIGVTIIGFARHGLHFFSFFVPSGVPVA